MVISNVGDSEAILCRGGKAVQLSTLHSPANEKEKARICMSLLFCCGNLRFEKTDAAGGTVVFYGTWRVNGVLAVTRSIGDRALKEQVRYHEVKKKQTN